MLKYPGPFLKKEWTNNERKQLAGLTKKDMAKLLGKDPCWEHVHDRGAKRVFYNPDIPSPYDFFLVHYHDEGFKNKGFLLHIIDHICWTRDQLKGWKVLK